MKHLMKFLITTCLMFALAIAFTIPGCNVIGGDGSATEKGQMSVRMTDAPGLYAEVNVDIERVEVNFGDSTDEDWVVLNTHSGMYNLLDLQDTVSVEIANQTEIEVGKINQIRMVLGTDNNVKLLSGETVNLALSSQANVGLKLNLNAEIQSGGKTEVLLDFDAEKSITDVNGTLKLNPVLKIESVKNK